MAIKELMNVIKTDLQPKKEDFNTKYCSKDTSDSFLKVFETANRSYNFNNEKMESFSLKPNEFDEKLKQNYDESSKSDYDDILGNLHNENSYMNKEKDFLNQECSAKRELNPQSQVKENSQTTQETAVNKAEPEQNQVKEIKEVSENKQEIQKKEEPTEKAEKVEAKVQENEAQKQKVAENTVIVKEKVQETEKQEQQPVKVESATDTSVKLLIENNLKNNLGEKVSELVSNKGKQVIPNNEQTKDVKAINIAKEEIKAEFKAEIKGEKAEKPANQEAIKPNVEQVKPETKEVKLTSPEIKTETKEIKLNNSEIKAETKEDKPQVAQKPVDQKEVEVKKPDVLNNLNVQEKLNKEKPEISDSSKGVKVKAEKATEVSKTHLPPPVKATVKEDVKIEDIKVLAASDAKKEIQEISLKMNLNNKGQQNPQQELKANINTNASADNAGQKVDVQKTAQFDRILSSKQPNSTQESVLNQVVKKATAELHGNKTQVQIVLKPENLGKVNLNLVSQKGVLTAQITAESQQVKDMLGKGLETLRQNLADQGINLGRININVQEPASANNNSTFDQAMHKFDQNGTSSETNTSSDKEDKTAENSSDSTDMEGYDFDEENEGEITNNLEQNPHGKVDYKV